MSGYSENVSLVDDVSNGVATTLSFEGESLIVKRTYDAEPFLKQAAQDRAASEGQRWGDMRKVFTLPPAEHGRFLVETRGQSQKEKSAWLRRWAAENPALVSFEKYLKR